MIARQRLVSSQAHMRCLNAVANSGRRGACRYRWLMAATSQSDSILTSLNDGVMTVTLNRPDKLNGVTSTMWGELGDIFTSAAGDEEVRALVMAGNGRGFCAGADLWDPERDNRPGHPLESMRRTHATALALHQFPKPTVARVQGVAAGAGVNLALGCDIIVASTEARFSEIFVKRGLALDFGGSWLLPRLVGMHKAKELALLGDILSAEEAREIGLINRVVAPELLDETVDDIASRLSAGPPLAMRLSKKLLNDSLSRSMSEALDAESAAQTIALSSKDTAEAIAAFAEKRNPTYIGR